MLMSAFIKKDSLLTESQSGSDADTSNVKVATLSMIYQNRSRLRLLCVLPNLILTHDRPHTTSWRRRECGWH